ncbi:GL19982 [Drosophila persimilis]|uniref:GL19982 n=1 Tax=Drosophila persimilis TaxID=7234 RepID=B4IQU9_DROPE|nr:GL19982 [Drosophila persimilis]
MLAPSLSLKSYTIIIEDIAEDARNSGKPQRRAVPIASDAPITDIEMITEAEEPAQQKSPDAVQNRAQKLALALQPSAFADVFNKCLLEGIFPDRWKTQKLLLLNKAGKPPGEPSSYRPICFLEKLIACRLSRAIEDAGGLSPNQYGFRKGRSTLDVTIVSIVTNIVENDISGTRSRERKKQYCLLVTLDIKNAFNTADWGRTMDALQMLRIPEYLLRIVSLSEWVLL